MPNDGIERIGVEVVTLGTEEAEKKLKAYQKRLKDVEENTEKIKGRLERNEYSASYRPKAQTRKSHNEAEIESLRKLIEQYTNLDTVIKDLANDSGAFYRLSDLPQTKTVSETSIGDGMLRKISTLDIGGARYIFTSIGDYITKITRKVIAVKDEAKQMATSLGAVKDFKLGDEDLVSRTRQLRAGVEQVTETYKKLEGTVETTYTAVDGQITKAISKTVELKKTLGAIADFGLTDEDLVSRKTTGDGTEAIYQVVDGDLIKRYKVLNGVVQSVSESFKKETKAKNKSVGAHRKLLKTIGRVAIYRIIRTALQGIEEALGSAINSFAMVDKTFNKSMSQITSSATMLASSLLSAVSPLLNSVAPVLNQVAIAFANFTNGIAKAVAKMQGLSTYTKVNTDYMKDYAASINAATFGFDKFNVISGGEKNPFEQASIADEAVVGETEQAFAELIENIKVLFQDVFGVVGEIFKMLQPLFKPIMEIANIIINLVREVLPIIEPILKPVLELVLLVLDLLKPILEAIEVALPMAIDFLMLQLQPILDFLSEVIMSMRETLLPIFEGIAVIVKAIALLLKGDVKGAAELAWNGIKLLGEGIVNALIASVNMFIDLLNMVWKMLAGMASVIWNPIASAIEALGGKDLRIRMETLPLIPKIPYVSFATGGEATKGTFMLAGENGAEIVTNNPRGSGALVSNTDQLYNYFFRAAYDAIVATDLPALIANGSNKDIYMDSEKVGKVVGGTRSLPNELFRRNLISKRV